MISAIKMTSLIDLLTDDSILYVFSHFDKLEDRAVLSQVSNRFNSLSMVRTWRKKIIISFDDVKKHKLYKFKNNKLLQEAKMSVNLKSLIIEQWNFSNQKEFVWTSKFETLLPHILSKIFQKCRKLNEVQCKISNRVHGGIVFLTADEMLIIHSFDDKPRFKYFNQMVNCFPGKFKSISHSGPQAHLETLLDRSSDVVEELGCSDLTLNPELVSILKKCKKLDVVEIYESLNVDPEMKIADYPKLNVINLLLPRRCNMMDLFNNHRKILGLFLTDSLPYLSISDHVLAGYETLVLQKCRNLVTLSIDMDREHPLSDEEETRFYKTILTLFAQYTTWTTIHIQPISGRFSYKFRDELLPLVYHYGFQETYFDRNAISSLGISKIF